MSASQVANALANSLAADAPFCDMLACLHLHLKSQMDLERVVEIREFPFSDFCGGCGSR
jgi:hypothetical protein